MSEMRDKVLAMLVGSYIADVAPDDKTGIEEAIELAIEETDIICEQGRLGIVYRKFFPKG